MVYVNNCKKVIRHDIRKKMLREYFEWSNAMSLAKKYWCEYNETKRYL